MSRTEASAAVGRAIERGELPEPKTLTCADCGSAAQVYDHYLGYDPEHWLDVQPVCIRHNATRGAQTRKAKYPGVLMTAVLIRLPDDVLADLDADAAAHLRSRNAQLIWILQERYGKRSSVSEDESERYAT